MFALSKNEDFLFAAAEDHSVSFWKIQDQTTTMIARRSVHQNLIYDVDVSCDGNLTISASRDKSCKLWDSSTGSLLKTL